MKVEALEILATEFRQLILLVLRLDALSESTQAQRLGQGNDRSNNALAT